MKGYRVIQLFIIFDKTIIGGELLFHPFGKILPQECDYSFIKLDILYKLVYLVYNDMYI